jgi:hypothetical protein
MCAQYWLALCPTRSQPRCVLAVSRRPVPLAGCCCSLLLCAVNRDDAAAATAPMVEPPLTGMQPISVKYVGCSLAFLLSCGCGSAAAHVAVAVGYVCMSVLLSQRALLEKPLCSSMPSWWVPPIS